MNESLRFLILLFMFLGIIIKTWEQVKKSEYFLDDIKAIWQKIFKQK